MMPSHARPDPRGRLCRSEVGEFRRGSAPDLPGAGPSGRARDSLAGECSPAIDVFETDEAMEIVASTCRASIRSAVRILDQRRRGADRWREAAAPRSKASRASTSSSAASGASRAPCASHAAVRRRPAHAPRSSDGELRISLPKIPDRRGRPIEVPIQASGRVRRVPAVGPAMRILFIGDIVGRPGRELVQRGLRALVELSRDRPRHRQRRERGGRLRHHARDRRRAARLGRRRDDVRQSHLGQEGSARLHRHRAAPAAAGQLPRRRARQRQLPGAHRATAQRRRHQRHGPRLHAEHRRSVRASCCSEIEALRRADARSSSSTSTPRRRRRRSRWAGTSTAR